VTANHLHPVEKEDLFRLKFVQGGRLSPDGKQAVYVVAHVDAEIEEEYSSLWLASLESDETRQFTFGKHRDSTPEWSPDGKLIAFTSTRSGKPQLYVIPADGGEARQLTDLKQGVGGGPVWSPDGKHLAFAAGPSGEPRDPAKPYRVRRHVYRFDALEYLDDVVQSLYVVSCEGGEPRQLTNDDCMNSNPQWSPDGKEILYAASMLPDVHKTFFPRLRVVDVVDGKVREIVGEWGEVTAAAWLPDGKHVAFIGQPDGLPIGSKSDLWIMDVAAGKPQNRTGSLKVGVGGGLQADMPVNAAFTRIPITKDGKTAYVQVQDGGTVQIYRVSLKGKESHEVVLSGERSCLLMDADERHELYIVSSINQPTDLFVCDLEGGNERQLTHVNDEVLSQRALPTYERLLFPGSDGAQVEGWIIKPPMGKPPYPTILYIHGGPHGAFGHVYHFDTQMLCGAGYAVLMINHRASTGYGDEFSTAIKGDWGNLDYKDLMAGVDDAVAKGLADPHRLGVCGLSGGGNLSCWTVGQTTRFKAAVPENPVTNWVSFYGVSDIGVWFAVEELGGHPHEIPEVYTKCSPITHAHRCKTPTLLIQGEHDWRCPAEQSEQFYAVLKANGCIVEMIRIPNSPHAGTIMGAPTNRRVHNEALLEWMDRYVLGKENGAVKA
jgi:dipeptidyl aminopeptidase/acylaminoacyl peptidase